GWYCLSGPLALPLASQDKLSAAFSTLCVGRTGATPRGLRLLYSSLMRAGNFHVLPVLRDRAASDLDTLRLKDGGDLLVRERPGGIFFVDQLLDAALQDQQRRVAALRSLHA